MQYSKWGWVVMGCLLVTSLAAQEAEEEYGGYFFGIKGGLTIGQQQWNNFERDPLLGWHGIAFIESLPAQGKFSLLAQLGYHTKGSSIRPLNFVDPGGGNQVFRNPAQTFEFYNLSLTAAAKQILKFSERGTGLYYLFGARLDYTLDTNLDLYEDAIRNNPQIAGFYPIEDDLFLQRVNYGLTVGGGAQFRFSEFVGANLELTINPDFSRQYRQPTIPNVQNPFNGQTTSIPEREIRNLTFEMTLGLRFLRKIIYLD